MIHRRHALAALAAAATSVTYGQAPSGKQIRLVAPQPAGTGPDVLARTLADELSKILGQSVVVENKTGANGTLAASYVLSQPADGHTLFLAGVSNMAWNPLLYKAMTHVPAKDFAGVAVIANTPFVTAVAPSLGVKTLADLVKKAKAEPGKLSFASSGIGNSTHLATELLMARTGIQMQHVPFGGTGGPSAMTSVISGETPVITTVPVSVVPQVKAGKLTALAVTGERRLSQLPDVPTFAELGIEMEVPGWYSIVTRTGSPSDVIQRLNAALNKAIETPQVMERLNQQMLTPIRSVPSDVERLTARDSAAWGPLIQRLGIAQ